MDKSKMIAAVPFHIEKGGQLTKGSTPGFHQLIPSLSELGSWTRKDHGGQETKDAIPLETARIEIFHNQIHRSKSELGEAVSEQEELWRRIISLFVLSKYRSLAIRTEVVTRNDCSDLVWRIFGENILQSTGMEDAVILMTYKEQLLAVSDLSTIWTPVIGLEDFEKIGIGQADTLIAYERDLILTYLKGIWNLGLECDIYTQRYAEILQAAGAYEKSNQDTKPVMPECSRRWQNKKPKSVIDAVFSIPVPGVELPYPFFHTLCLTADKINGRLNNLTFTVRDPEEGVRTLTALLPLSREFVEVLEDSGDVVLESVSIKGEAFRRTQELSVSLGVSVRGETITYQRIYTKKEIRYSVNMPGISVFPYVNLPQNIWHDYNLILLKSRKKEDLTFMGRMDLGELDATRIDFEQFPTTKQEKKITALYQWYYAKLNKLPKFITLCETDMEDENKLNENKRAGYIGCIALERPEDAAHSQSIFNKTYFWAIDLGTSNTIAALEGEGNRINYDLIKENVHMPIVESTRYADMGNFAVWAYAPITPRIGKYRTMGNVYKFHETGVANHCYEHGNAFFATFADTVDILKEDKSLADYAIFTDIKFGSRADLDRIALQIYLENLLWLGCLNATLCGARNLEVMISYPRKEVLDRIDRVWRDVQNGMKQKCGLKIALHYMTEAEANYRYQRKIAANSSERIGVTNDFGIIDIGHGTSDMNLYFHTESRGEAPKQVQISVRYAGREILVDTINRFFQKDPDAFRSIWNIVSTAEIGRSKDADQAKTWQERNARGEQLIKEYVKNTNKLTASGTPDRAAGVQENKSMLEAKRCDILITLLQEIGMRGDLCATLETQKNQQLVLLLKIKYMNLFLIYANILRDCPKSSSDSSFKFFIYGGGKHGLQAIIGDSLEKIHDTGFGKAVRTALSEAMGIPMSQTSIIVQDSHKKTEVVEGMLYEADQDSEKRDVYSERTEVEQFLGYPDEEVGPDIWDAKLRKTLEQMYTEFVKFYSPDTSSVAEVFSLDDTEPQLAYWYMTIDNALCKNDEQREMVKKNRESFGSWAQSVWGSISNDKENPSKILYLLFCCKMSEEILLDHLR